MKKLIKLILIIAITFGLFACDQFILSEEEESKCTEEVTALMNKHFNANKTENLKEVLETIDTANISEAKKLYTTIFENYDLSYKFEIVDITIVSKDWAEVKVLQTTKKIKGPAFANNITESVHTVEKIDGKWKITETEILDFEEI